MSIPKIDGCLAYSWDASQVANHAVPGTTAHSPRKPDDVPQKSTPQPYLTFDIDFAH